MAPSPPFTYPFATSPDIIRSHQKDAYFSAHLSEQLSTLLRTLRGARYAHTYTSEARVAADFLYLGLTTLIGNRTLGEEYCDVVQVEGDSGRLPEIGRRAGYIVCFVLGPYAVGKLLPGFKRRVRAKMEANLRRDERVRTKAQQRGESARSSKTASISIRLQRYLLRNLDTFTSPSPIYALSLATFYFTGGYYHLSKRLWNLRYIFTRRVQDSDARAGYEVLGVLLVLQMAVQAYLHIQNTMTEYDEASSTALSGTGVGTSAVVGPGVEVSLDPLAYTSNNALLSSTSTSSSTAPPSQLSKWTHTPIHSTPQHTLADPETMAWIPSATRKCTLCLEGIKDPSATTCGHVFCWECICDWVRERPECPLCRGSVGMQHILLLRD